METYKKWPEEINLSSFNTGYLLQYDLTNSKDCEIPFQIIEWVSGYNTEDWGDVDEGSTEVEIIYKGGIWFDGIRHSNFTEKDDGQMHYIKLKSLAKGLTVLNELCEKYCSSYYEFDK